MSRPRRPCADNGRAARASGSPPAPQMLPQAYLLLDRLPLNANGKVDTRALPAVEIAETPAEAPVEPRTPEERILARIWADLLTTAGFGVRDNFFHVGGDSILTIRLVARAYEAGLDLELKDVFEQPTIEGLAAIALRRQRAVQARSHGARYGAELIAAACDSRNPCRLSASRCRPPSRRSISAMRSSASPNGTTRCASCGWRTPPGARSPSPISSPPCPCASSMCPRPRSTISTAGSRRTAPGWRVASTWRRG